MKKLLLLLYATSAYATTTITDTIRVYDGNLFTGKITITAPLMTTAAGDTIAGWQRTYTITAGAFSAALEPNDTATPAGTSYLVRYLPNQGSALMEYWVVTTSATPLKIGAVRVSSVPTPALTIALSQLSTSGAVKGDIMAFGTAWGSQAVGANGYVLTADSAQSRGIKWAAATGGVTSVFGRSPVVVAASGDYNTSQVTEVTNLYFTNLRATTAMAGLYEVPLTFTLPLVRTVNAISIPSATGSRDGYLTLGDWTTFNGKAATGSCTGNQFAQVISSSSVTCATAAGGITTLNTLTGATQTFATGTTGTDFAINSSGTVHTFNIPTASASARGLLSSANWSTFNSKLGFTGTPTANAILKGDGTGAVPSGCLIDNSDNMSCPGTITSGSAATGGFRMTGATSGSTVVMTVSPTTAAGTITVPGGLTDTMVTQTTGYAGIFPGATLYGANWIRVKADNAASGNVDLYTSGTLKRTYIAGCSFYNTAGTSTTVSMKLKRSGVYYRLNADAVVSTVTASSQSPDIILEPTDTIAINTSQAGINVNCRAIEFSSSVRVHTAILLSLTAGDNTVYTCPASSTCTIAPAADSAAWTAIFPAIMYANESGGARTVHWNFVTSGGAAGSTNQISVAASVTNLQAPVNVRGGPSMQAGDFISINTDANTATQVARVNVIELP